VSENVDLVRAIYADWKRGDFSRTDWAHPEIEFVMADGPDPGKSRGVRATAEAWRAQMSVSKDYRVEADKHRELDTDRIQVLIAHGGRGKASGLAAEQLTRRAQACLTSDTARLRGSPSIGSATAPSPTSASRSGRCRRTFDLERAEGATKPPAPQEARSEWIRSGSTRSESARWGG
jgi:hypothetical protein